MRNQVTLMLIALMGIGCRPESDEISVVRSQMVSFSELFQPVDTIRVDASVLVGHYTFIDVDKAGNLLITDEAGQITHLFSATGVYMTSYSVPECVPDEGDFLPSISRFIGDGRIVVMGQGRGAAVFDRGGDCLVGTRMWNNLSKSICTQEDSIFMHKGVPRGKTSVSVYDSALEHLTDFPIRSPRLLMLNATTQGLPGRSLECFDDGAHYLYIEDMDSWPVRVDGNRIRYQPDFFQRRPDDVADYAPIEQLSEYPLVMGIFALDKSTRMVGFIDIGRKWARRSGESGLMVGLSVASNENLFPGRSTFAHVWPTSAGNGYLYTKGEHESLPDGEVGNPILVRFRFIPPQSDEE
ncbi:MAG: hypothetical protein OXL40_06080 [Bacteroidota bacterium]|nr:hypothetical protein [Bacteroidota bacterium]